MKILHIVHCIDTEGPLDENLSSTFQRINNTFGIDIKCSSLNLKKLQSNSLNRYLKN